jgi:sugar O-acyltransferase (sialic acid O-acetyltransferase NeuD family)
MSKSMVILGAGGHGRVVLSLAQILGINVLFLTDSDSSKHGKKVLGVEIAGGDEILLNISPDEIDLAMGLGVGSNGGELINQLKRRFDFFSALTKKGFAFPVLIHPRAWVADDCSIGQGTQVFAGSIVQPSCSIGDLAIINTMVSVDHDSKIGGGVHLAPGVTCGGSIKIGDNSHIGIGATILPNINIGKEVVIAAGALANTNIVEGTKVSGIPAKLLKP